MEAEKKIEEMWTGWKVVEQIGQGAYGKVYKVKKEAYGQVSYRAVKVIQIPSDQAEVDQMTQSGMTRESIHEYYGDAINRMLSEIELMEKMKPESHVVDIEDWAVVEGSDGISKTIYIRMELLESLPYSQKVKQLDQKEVAKIGIDICSALEYCHEQHIIHRDIKPSNIFVSEKGDYKLGDFGVARQVEMKSMSMSQKGTYDYMAPEMLQMKKYDERVDIYALGVTLYMYLNHGRMPFLPPYPEQFSIADRENAMYRRLSGTEPMPLPDNADPELGKIICKACAYEKTERYSAAAEMKQDLMNWMTTGQSDIRTEHINSSYTDEDQTVKAEFRTGTPEVKQVNTSKKKKTVILSAILAGGIVVVASATLFILNRQSVQEGVPEEPIAVNSSAEYNAEDTATPSPTEEPESENTEPAALPITIERLESDDMKSLFQILSMVERPFSSEEELEGNLCYYIAYVYSRGFGEGPYPQDGNSNYIVPEEDVRSYVEKNLGHTISDSPVQIQDDCAMQYADGIYYISSGASGTPYTYEFASVQETESGFQVTVNVSQNNQVEYFYTFELLPSDMPNGYTIISAQKQLNTEITGQSAANENTLTRDMLETDEATALLTKIASGELFSGWDELSTVLWLYVYDEFTGERFSEYNYVNEKGLEVPQEDVYTYVYDTFGREPDTPYFYEENPNNGAGASPLISLQDGNYYFTMADGEGTINNVTIDSIFAEGSQAEIFVTLIRYNEYVRDDAEIIDRRILAESADTPLGFVITEVSEDWY